VYSTALPNGLVARLYSGSTPSADASSARDLGGGWVAIHSPEHMRDYFWHRSTGEVVWELPGQEHVATTSQASAATPQSRSDGVDLASGVGKDETAQSSQLSQPVDGSLRARDLPDGWVAVYSAAHNCEYFWHRDSGETTWTAPVLGTAQKESVPAAVADATTARAETSQRGSGDWRAVQKAIRRMMSKYQLGQELEPADFFLVRGLLVYHPDSEAKIGCGVRSIKLDVSLDESGSRCFWVLRTDGSSEDFSARKCLDAFRISDS